MSATVADVIARALRRNGVSAIFGQSIPAALFLAAEDAGIRQVAYRMENAGGAMADGFARISRKIGVVGAQNGPAATLLVPPLAEAMKASIPILALVEEVPLAKRHRNAFQELDHAQLFSVCSKWIRCLDDPARVDDFVDAAIAHATSGRPGPAVLLLPQDILQLPTGSASSRRAILGRFPLDPTRPDAARICEAAEALARAERPLVVVGGGVHISGAVDALVRVQSSASLPVATTNMGKGSVDEGHRLSLGVIGNYMGPRGATRPLRELVTGADVVLLVGTRTNENGTDTWSLLPRGATFIHLDIDSSEVGRNYESQRLVGDARLGLEDLADALGALDLSKRKAGEADVAARIAEGRRLHRSEAAAFTGSGASPIRPERVMAELDTLLPDDAIVVADASYSTIWMNNYLRARRAGQRFLSPRGLAGLGWGLPLALGAKAARPAAPVVCINGDGGFGHVWAELETSVREQLPVTVILLNNAVLGFQKHAELMQYGAHTTAVDFGAVDHVAIARACGADGVRVDEPADLRDELASALASNRTTLIEVVTDPDAYPPITSWEGRENAIVPVGDCGPLAGAPGAHGVAP